MNLVGYIFQNKTILWYSYIFECSKILNGRLQSINVQVFFFVAILVLIHTSDLWFADDDQRDCSQGICPCVS